MHNFNASIHKIEALVLQSQLRDQEDVLLLLRLQHEPISLEQPVYAEDETITLGQTLATSDETGQREWQREVAALLTHLSPRERRVIQTRYQLGHEATHGLCNELSSSKGPCTKPP